MSDLVERLREIGEEHIAREFERMERTVADVIANEAGWREQAERLRAELEQAETSLDIARDQRARATDALAQEQRAHTADQQTLTTALNALHAYDPESVGILLAPRTES